MMSQDPRTGRLGDNRSISWPCRIFYSLAVALLLVTLFVGVIRP